MEEFDPDQPDDALGGTLEEETGGFWYFEVEHSRITNVKADILVRKVPYKIDYTQSDAVIFLDYRGMTTTPANLRTMMTRAVNSTKGYKKHYIKKSTLEAWNAAPGPVARLHF